MDLFPVSDEHKALLEELRALMAAEADPGDRKLLDDEANAQQLQESDLLRYIKARKFVVADAYKQLIETLRWRATWGFFFFFFPSFLDLVLTHSSVLSILEWTRFFATANIPTRSSSR